MQTCKQLDSSLSFFSDLTVEERNAFLLYDWINGNRLCRFKTPAGNHPIPFIFSRSLDYLKQLSGACVTMLASEEKPCSQLFLVCYLHKSLQRLNKQEELPSGCSICIRALTHVRTHMSTWRTKQTDHLLPSPIHTHPVAYIMYTVHTSGLTGLHPN